MKLSSQKPPVWDLITKVFSVDWEKGVAVAYGDTVYSKFDLPPDLIAHEQTHLDQQWGINPDDWWDKYINDPQFRLSQEVEAYRNQVLWIKKHVKDRNLIAKMVHKLCIDLSGLMYGDLVTYSEAKRLIS